MYDFFLLYKIGHLMNLNNIYFKVLLVFNIMVIRMIGILHAIMVMRTGEGKMENRPHFHFHVR